MEETNDFEKQLILLQEEGIKIEKWLNEMSDKGWQLYGKTVKYKFHKTPHPHHRKSVSSHLQN